MQNQADVLQARNDARRFVDHDPGAAETAASPDSSNQSTNTNMVENHHNVNGAVRTTIQQRDGGRADLSAADVSNSTPTTPQQSATGSSEKQTQQEFERQQKLLREIVVRRTLYHFPAAMTTSSLARDIRNQMNGVINFALIYSNEFRNIQQRVFHLDALESAEVGKPMALCLYTGRYVSRHNTTNPCSTD